MPCQHLDYALTLDGGKCNDCGIELVCDDGTSASTECECALGRCGRLVTENDVVALVRAAQMAEGVLREMHQHDEALEVAEALKPFEALLHARSAPPSP